MNGYKFGDHLIYTPLFKTPMKGTGCLYIRDDDGLAVVLFENAEWVARVNYSNLRADYNNYLLNKDSEDDYDKPMWPSWDK
jgi:hypothetical protein